MNLVKPFVRILRMTEDPLGLIEEAGRTCYKSEDRITETSKLDFVGMIIKRGHETVLEHASATVRFVVDRGVSHEIVRHRIASFSQESTRYCDYEKGSVSFIIPPWCQVGDGFCEDPNIATNHQDFLWLSHMLRCEADYKDLRDRGWRPEQARSVLPNSLKTEIVMTANFREWRHFFKLRTAPAAHPQMVQVAAYLLHLFRARVPLVFDDIKQD